MPLPEKKNLKLKPMLKIAGLAILALIVIIIAFSFISSLFGSFSNRYYPSNYGFSKSFSDGSASYESASMAPSPASGLGLSVRNVLLKEDSSNYKQSAATSGNQAENFEVTEYNARIETRQLDKTCAAVSGLKAREDVIFESANKYTSGCNYTFKVNREKKDEIVAILKGLDPRDLSENTQTIQNQVVDYTSEIDTLQKKLAIVDETLNKAIIAYDEVAQFATSARDVENMAKVVDKKLDLIERLTTSRLNINSQLEQIQRSKAEKLDQLNYTNFSVSVSKKEFVNWQNLGDSWNYAIKQAANSINQALQNISINLVGFIFDLLQYAIYAIILLFVAKYGWKMVKSIWQK